MRMRLKYGSFIKSDGTDCLVEQMEVKNWVLLSWSMEVNLHLSPKHVVWWLFFIFRLLDSHVDLLQRLEANRSSSAPWKRWRRIWKFSEFLEQTQWPFFGSCHIDCRCQCIQITYILEFWMTCKCYCRFRFIYVPLSYIPTTKKMQSWVLCDRNPGNHRREHRDTQRCPRLCPLRTTWQPGMRAVDQKTKPKPSSIESAL